MEWWQWVILGVCTPAIALCVYGLWVLGSEVRREKFILGDIRAHESAGEAGKEEADE